MESSDVLGVTLSSTIVSFLIISILTFIAGFVCGHYFGRKYKGLLIKNISSNSPIASQPVPLYEDVNVLPSTLEHHEKDFELKENVAYGPSKSMSIEQ